MASHKWFRFSVIFVFVSLNFCLCASDRRSDDDYVTITTVVQQLSQRVAALEASKIALENKVTAMQNHLAVMKCQSGEVSFNPHEQQEVTTNGVKQRIHVIHVTFPTSFAGTPVVTSGLTFIDSNNGDSADRIDSSVDHVTASGFDLSVREWIDTHNFRVDVAWMACLI